MYESIKYSWKPEHITNCCGYLGNPMTKTVTGKQSLRCCKCGKEV